jgi:hypothetical protein
MGGNGQFKCSRPVECGAECATVEGGRQAGGALAVPVVGALVLTWPVLTAWSARQRAVRRCKYAGFCVGWAFSSFHARSAVSR